MTRQSLSLALPFLLPSNYPGLAVHRPALERHNLPTDLPCRACVVDLPPRAVSELADDVIRRARTAAEVVVLNTVDRRLRGFETLQSPIAAECCYILLHRSLAAVEVRITTMSHTMLVAILG